MTGTTDPLDLGLEEFAAARRRIRDRMHRTPLFTATLLGERLGVDLHLKCENLQKTGSFKVRGVLNKVLGLTAAEKDRGVVTVSAGNHAQALAWAAGSADIPATVVMPESAPRTKVTASQGYGARVVLHGSVFDAFDRALELSEEEGLTFVHPFDDPALMAGHGSIALEIEEDLPEADAVVVPVGGGGLISGIAAAAAAAETGTRVYGVEPEGAASMRRSLERGEPVRLEEVDTVADGLASPMAGDHTYRVVRRHVEQVLTVSDEQIVEAVGRVLSWAKLLAEPAGAASVAALASPDAGRLAGETVVCVLSGGNVDREQLGEFLAG